MLPEAVTTVQFDAALLRATARAAATYPTERERIERGLQIALAEGVTFLPTGLAVVASQSHPGEWYHVNGHCTCLDVAQAPAGRCKHRWAKSLVKWARTAEADTPPPPVVRCPRCWVAFADDEAAVPGDVCVVCAAIEATPALTALPQGPAPATPPTIPAQYVVTLHGKSFVQYAGLLAMAHARGLVSLKVHFISVTDTLALAEAEAIFADGSTYSECADSTPQNVGATVKAHFPRMALTRAKSRCLRDALNIGMCSLEELAEA